MAAIRDVYGHRGFRFRFRFLFFSFFFFLFFLAFRSRGIISLILTWFVGEGGMIRDLFRCVN